MGWGKTKYRNQKTERAGRSFASSLEANLFDLLSLLEKAGKIIELKQQPSVYLTKARIRYVPDFSAYDTELDEMTWYEAKGFETPVWRIKRRLWQHYGPGRLFVYKGRGKNLVQAEEIIPK